MVFWHICLSFPAWIIYALFNHLLIHLPSWQICTEHRSCSQNWAGHWDIRRFSCSLEAFYWNSQHIPLRITMQPSRKTTFFWFLCHHCLAGVFLGMDFYSGHFSKDQRQCMSASHFLHKGWSLRDLHNLFFTWPTGRPHRRVLPECLEADEPP